MAETTKYSGIPAHAICFFTDGDVWCCVFGDFINLQESPAGFGKKFEEALADLRANAAVDWMLENLRKAT